MIDPYLAEQLAFYEAGGGKPQQPTTAQDLAQLLGSIQSLGSTAQSIAAPYIKKKQEDEKAKFEFRSSVAKEHPEMFKTVGEMEDFVNKGITSRPVFSDVQAEGPSNQMTETAPDGSLSPVKLVPPPMVKTQTGTEPIIPTAKGQPKVIVDQQWSELTGIPIGTQATHDELKIAAAQKMVKEKGNKIPNDETPLTVDESWSKATGLKVGTQTTLGAAKALAGQRSKEFNPLADVRGAQNISQDLPSNQSPSTVGGAASQVLFAARQGKSLIANPGSPQKLALAAADLARAVQRSAPQMETMQGASFSNNVVTKMDQLAQRITADPSGKDVPKMRREIFDILDDMEKSASPMVERQLKVVESLWGKRLPENWKEIRGQQMGTDIPDIQFREKAEPTKKDGKGKKTDEPELSAEDKEAIAWARANPKDPRSKKILDLHGVQ